MAIEPRVKSAIQEAVTREPFAQALKMELINLALGHSVVEMVYDPVGMNNIYERIHGGAIFALIDEAFETASQTDGTIAVALNVNVSYVCSPEQGARLRAEAQRLNQTRKTALYDIKVTGTDGILVATCQAMAYRTGKPIPFL